MGQDTIESLRNDLNFVKNRVSNHNASIDYLTRAVQSKADTRVLAQLMAARRALVIAVTALCGVAAALCGTTALLALRVLS